LAYEENRLTTVHDDGNIPMLSSYLYNAGGERVWKLSNDESSLRLRGNSVHRSVKFNKTLYISPLMVMNDKEYTKHYFIEGERVCTKVGGGFRYAPTDPDAVQLQFMGTSTATSVSDDLWTMTIRGVDCSGYPSARVSVKPKLRPARNDASRAESQQYFYHPDHLGSSSFVTDAAGLVEQHMQYLPFGELFVNQQNSTYDTRYKFSAKELDPETNYSYFGARYYDSDLSVWLSVDPMSDKHPNYSPYAYCYNNPTTYIDPFGLDTILFNKYGEFQTPLPGGDKETDTYVRVNTKEFDNNKIDYNNKGKLRNRQHRHKHIQIDKSFRESKKTFDKTETYRSDGYEKSKEIFEFFASNTIVEWAQDIYKHNNTGEIMCEISTNHSETNVTTNSPYHNGDYTLIDMRHSHPKWFISPADRQTHYFKNLEGPVKSYVYKSAKYYGYESERSRDENYSDEPQSY
jgi:RHS repeat-associated protein